MDHRGLLRVADAVGPVDVPPAAVLSRLAVRQRTMGARDPSLDRLRAACELRRAHRAILARQFLELGRHRLDGRDRARVAQRGGRRSRGRAVQRRAEVRVLVDGAARARALPHRPRHLGRLFRRGDDHRDPEGRGAHSQLCGDRGDHRLDHPCLRGDLGARLDARNDARLCDPRLGVASSSQMAARASSRQAREALVRGARPRVHDRAMPSPPTPLPRERGETAAALSLLPQGEGGTRSEPGLRTASRPDEGPPASAARRS